MRILYVEDEKYLADAVIHILDASGISVDWVADGGEGLDLALKPVYDAVVLDVMLPTMSGFDILKDMRERGVKTPVIMLSALSQVEDKVKGLNFGADDYLAKPFKTQELIARLKALTRRPPLAAEEVLSYGDLKFDMQNRTLNGLHLSEKEANIIESLLKTPERVQNKEFLLTRVWGNEGVADDNYVEVYISHLRKTLKKLKSQCEIKTIRGLGYKLCQG